MVVGIALLLVVGIAKMLGGSSDGSSGDAARNVADTTPAPDPTTSGAPVTQGPTTPGDHQGKGKKVDDPATRPVMPSGPCDASDVAITPSVPKPIAGDDIKLVLDISSVSTPACTWTLSPRTTAVKITSGSDLIWTSVECPKTIPRRDLVVRQDDPVRVKLTWNAMRSEPGCRGLTQWALPGTYHLQVAALAGQPQDVTFLLTAPSPAEVTKTAHPHQHHGHDQHTSKKKSDKPD